MTKLQEYFHTDWNAMTATDWFGLVFTVVIFLLMVGLYFWVLNPKNKDKLESHRTMPLDDDETNSEKKDG
ncbi:cbb3-type cytochrome c oxidase subunit 3 [Methylophaga sp. OBS4]|uniref:cbb3-type cytochrome c oxidase subunit 3 n=1 Tax=Methylophaga sp. OBS4 TaxID=2991935 RepID=UPI00224FD570|nr:cbb3-type cytochrome c oxidase subunit 3 [Methylophaga sp. OBS4]MCX4187542.1 cbb3-type cytochrome c oxidase subunit 3 [Methylophaga sp. OBS4]